MNKSTMDTKEICECGHEKYTHGGTTMQCIYAINGDFICPCASFRPAPSQPSMRVSECCDKCLAFGRSNERLHDYDIPVCRNVRCECHMKNCAPEKKEKESTEVRDEKIARIVKEFREKFYQDTTGECIEGWLAMKTGKIIEGDDREFCKIAIPSDIEAWLTQTLTTLLNR